MKILMLAPQPFFEPRGTPISVHDRLKTLSKLGFLVDLITYPIGEDVEFDGLRIFRTNKIFFINSIKIGPSFHKVILDLLLLVKSIFFLIKGDYDVIHSHEEAAYFGVILGKLFRVPHIYDMHSRLPWQLRNSQYKNWIPLVWLFEFLEKYTLSSSEAIITIGDDLESYVNQINPTVNHVKIYNLPLYANFSNENSIQFVQKLEELNIRNKLKVVYTGTLEKYQGIELLVESAMHLVKSIDNVVFILVGGTTEQVGKLYRQICDLRMEEHFKLLGTVSPVDAIQYLDIADVLVSPRTSGMSVPLKIYTYLFSGKPIVATDIPAHQIEGEKNLHLVDPSPKCLAQELEYILNRKNNQLDLGNHKILIDKLNDTISEYDSMVEKVYKSFQKYPK